MSFFSQNLAILEKRDPLLAERVCQVSSEAVSTMTSLCGEKFWKDQGINFPLILNFYGLGSGDHIRHFLRHRHPRNKAIVIIEKEISHFRRFLESIDGKDFFRPDIEWVVGEEGVSLWNHGYDFFKKNFNFCYGSGIENVFWKPSLEKDGDYYLGVAKVFQKTLERVLANIQGDPEDQYRGLINILPNLSLVPETPFFDQWKNKFYGKPGIVVSTGPSLNKSLPFLKKMRAEERAVIFAVDSAVSVLATAGIEPHFVSCLERVVLTEKLFHNLPELKKTVFVSNLAVYPETLKHFQNRAFILTSSLPTKLFLPQQLMYRLGSSASTMAFEGLKILGCDPIILLGQDLAYDPYSKKSHATGAQEFLQSYGEQVRARAEKEENSWAEGNNGKPILTWAAYQHIAKNFEDLFQSGLTRVINAIPQDYGMKLEGVVRQDPEVALSQNLKESFLVFSKLSFHQENVSMSDIHASLKKIGSDLETIRLWALYQLDVGSRFFHHNLPSLVTPEMEEAYKTMNQQFEKSFETTVGSEKTFSNFLIHFLVADQLKLMNKIYDLESKKLSFPEGTELIFHAWQKLFEKVMFWASRTQAILKVSNAYESNT